MGGAKSEFVWLVRIDSSLCVYAFMLGYRLIFKSYHFNMPLLVFRCR